MTVTNGYTTLIALKARLNLTDNDDDSIVESIINAVSRLIDRYCKRRFYTTSADETRYYTATDPAVFFSPDDILSVTTLKTDDDGDRTHETTWTALTDYLPWPYNATLDSVPYTQIKVSPATTKAFPLGDRGVQIVGEFGYCATGSHPAQIAEACLLQCERLYKRKDAPFGIAGAGDMGQMRMVIPNKLDPDVEQLLSPFVR